MNPARRTQAAWLTAFLLACLPASAGITFNPAATGSGWSGGTFADTSFEGVRYVSSQFLESLFGREGAWVPDRQKFVLPDSTGRNWYFTLDNPFMNIGEEVGNLVYPVRRGPEYLYLPLPPLLRLLKQKGWSIASPAVDFAGDETPPENPGKPPAGKAISFPNGSNILDVGAEDRENGTLVSLRVAGPMEWESLWAPPHYILRFQGGLVAPQYPLKAQGAGLVKSIHTVQEKELVQVTLNIPRAIDTVEVAYSGESRVYQVTVRKKSAKKEKALRDSVAADTAAKAKAAKTATIIIDPGHGGKDQGAMVSGVHEAQVTLAVAKQLKTALTKLGYKAILTREDDTYISLPERPKFASDMGGDLFISLHCNSIGGSRNRKQAVSGFISYILREGESEEDKALARRENEAIGAESTGKSKAEISPVEWILLEHQLNLYSKESETFAENIMKAFEGHSIAKYATGASQAGFYVLVGAYMPAVLFEMGFLSNDKDRRLLASDKGQKQIADRLAKAIDRQRSAGQAVKPGKRDGK